MAVRTVAGTGAHASILLGQHNSASLPSGQGANTFTTPLGNISPARGRHVKACGDS